MKYPSINKPYIGLNAFDGGLVTKVNNSNLLANQSPDLSCVKFSNLGSVETIEGFSNITSTPVGSGPIKGLAVNQYSGGSVEYLVFACSGTIYRTSCVPPSSGPVSAITGGTGIVSTINDVKFLNHKNQLFFSDGVTYGYRYTNNEIFQAGIRPAPNSAASVISTIAVATSHPTGLYEYKMTGVNSLGQEGGETYLGQYTLVVANRTISVTSIPVFPYSANVVNKNIYVKEPGTLVYYYEGQIPNATTTYTDASGNTLVTVLPSLGPMPIHKYSCEYKGIVFTSGDPNNRTRLYYSEAGFPENFPLANYLDIGDGDESPISGLTVYNGMVNIHKNDGYGKGCIYVLAMPSLSVSDWEVVKTNSKYGTISDKAITGTNDKCLFINKGGMYKFFMNFMADNPQYTVMGNFSVDSISWAIEPEVLALSYPNLYKSCAIDFDNKIIFSVAKDTSYNGIVLIWDYNTTPNTSNGQGAWSVMPVGFNNFVIYKGFLIAGSSTTGMLYHFLRENYYNFDGVAYESRYTTKTFYGSDEIRDNYKAWRFFVVELEKTGDYFVKIGYRTNENSEFTYVNIDVSSQSTEWGSFLWGGASWGSSGGRFYYTGTIRAGLSKYIQFSFKTTNIDEKFVVSSLRVYYNIRGQKHGAE